MPILQIRDEDGNFVPINALRGDVGKSAYEQAKEGGYMGTEEEFITLLNSLTDRVQIKTGTYEGTGNYGEDYPNMLTFDFDPKFIIITGDDGTFNSCTNVIDVDDAMVSCPPSFATSVNGIRAGCMVTVGEHSITWYSSGVYWQKDSSSAESTNADNLIDEQKAYCQLNGLGEYYYYIAIG